MKMFKVIIDTVICWKILLFQIQLIDNYLLDIYLLCPVFVCLFTYMYIISYLHDCFWSIGQISW